MKNKIIILSIILLLFSLVFVNNNVFAETATNTLIVDGYDMSDIYNYFTVDDAFFIVDWANQGNEYYLAVPGASGYRSYCAISAVNSCLYYNENWEALDGHSYSFYKFNTETLKFEYGWYGHLNDWTLDNGCLYFAYSSKGIYNQDHESFFLKAPVTEVPEEIPGTLEEIMNKAGKQAEQEITQIILIVIMITAGLMVLLIGLRKGSTVLMNGFRH